MSGNANATASKFAALFLCAILLAASGVWNEGCVSAPPAPLVSRREVIQKDGKVGLELAPQVESQLEFRSDTEVSVYLRRLAERLMNTQPELQNSAVGVFVIEDQAKWWDYAVPGTRIYLSAGFLRAADYENQVAAAIAMELSHVLRRDVATRVEQVEQKASEHPEFAKLDYFGPSGIFVFPEAARIEAVDTAVDILYKAGFDPRGIVELWLTYQANAGHSPFETSTLDKLLDKSRQAVASYAPLRNPIVRSDQFTRIQKRIKRL